MKLSVIIPVYNAETYLEKCVESVASFPVEKEIVLVDDGSTDHSGEICDRFQVSGSRFQVSGFKFQGSGFKFQVSGFKVIHQENKGVSAARNAGLDVATGDYVWFVDADDTVLAPTNQNLSSLIHHSTTHNIQPTPLIIFGFVWDEDGVAKSFGASKDEVPYNLWRCWFDRKTIEERKIRFTEGRKYAEDQEFILGFMVSGFRFQVSGSRFQVSGFRFQVSAINEPLYYYTLRPGSAMTRKGVKSKKVADVAAVLFGFAWRALMSGAIAQGWAWREIRRMTKSLYITIKR